MKIRKILISVLLGASMTSFAQKEGGISPQMLQQLRASYELTPANKAIRNALNAEDINVLAVNWDNSKKVDTHFSDKVVSKGITNQLHSGRCWLFTGLNVLRAKMIQKYDLPTFTLSQNYVYFYDQLEKSNLFLQGVVDTRKKPMDDQMVNWLFKHPLSDGGQFTGVSDLIMKYGVVPSEAWPETRSSNNTSSLDKILKLKLREFGLELRRLPKEASAKDVKAKKTEMLETIYKILCLNFGEPPTEFVWARKNKANKVVDTQTYTPLSFYKKYIDKDLTTSYVMLMNDPCREYYKVYEINFDRHVYDGYNWVYLNLPIEEIKAAAIASIKDSTMMYFSCDVGKFFDRQRGLLDLNNYDYASLFGTSFKMNKKDRVSTFASGSSHAMTLMAVDLASDGTTKKWMVENSWGSTGFNGHVIMTDEWFNEYMFRLVVEKKYLSKKLLKLSKQKPTLLPAWDPMFEDEK